MRDRTAWRWRWKEKARARGILLLAIVPTLALAGCGNLTAGGVSEAEVLVSGDGPEGSSGSAAGTAGPSWSEAAPEGVVDLPGQPFQGDVTVELRVLLLPQEGEPREISDGSREVTVDVRGEVPASLGAVRIPPGTYTGIRVVFRRVEANLTAGIGQGGLPIEGLVRVDLDADAPLELDRSLAAAVDEDRRLVVTVDLRSSSWLSLAGPAGNLVPAPAFRSAVVVRSELREGSR